MKKLTVFSFDCINAYTYSHALVTYMRRKNTTDYIHFKHYWRVPRYSRQSHVQALVVEAQIIFYQSIKEDRTHANCTYIARGIVMRDIIELYRTLLCQLRYITMRMSPIRDAFSHVFHTRLRFRTRSIIYDINYYSCGLLMNQRRFNAGPTFIAHEFLTSQLHIDELYQYPRANCISYKSYHLVLVLIKNARSLISVARGGHAQHRAKKLLISSVPL